MVSFSKSIADRLVRVASARACAITPSSSAITGAVCELRRLGTGLPVAVTSGAILADAAGSGSGKDTAALVSTAGEYGLAMPIVQAARDINRRQREYVVDKLLGELKILKGRTIGLLGLAFKPNTDDLREAPAIDIAQKLLDRGCRVKAHDPVARERFEKEYGAMGVVCCEHPEDTADDADALVLVTEWPQYLDLDWENVAGRMRTRILVDGRHVLDRARLTKHGFRYLAIAG